MEAQPPACGLYLNRRRPPAQRVRSSAPEWSSGDLVNTVLPSREHCGSNLFLASHLTVKLSSLRGR
jgi:hypothetical protein